MTQCSYGTKTSHMKTAICCKSDRWWRKRELLCALLNMTLVIWVPAFTDEKSPKIYDLATAEKQRHFEMKVLCGWMIWPCPQWKIHFEQFVWFFFSIPFSFAPPSCRDLRETFVLCCHCYFCPNSAVKRFMAVACAHSYSFVSIETLSPGQACILELHKALPVIRNTLRYEYSCLTGILF